MLESDILKAANIESNPQHRSLMGYMWSKADVCDVRTQTLVQQHDFPELLARLAALRCPEHIDINHFLDPKLRYFFKDPLSMKDMEKSVNRISKAIHQKEKVGILGDYDVDGACSTALLIKYLTAHEAETTFHIPDRIKEGYGPSRYGIDKLKAEGVKLMITVDCGTAAVEMIDYANTQGMDVIIIDHHLPESALPKAFAVVNPNRADDESGLGHLSAGGVTFFLLAALQKILDPESKKMNIMSLLDLVALSTMCDVVPLKDINRAFIVQGLKVLRQSENLGIQALQKAFGLEEPLNVNHMGFSFGPHINAGGRVGEPSFGTSLLTATKQEAADRIVKALLKSNQARKEIESQILKEALAKADDYTGDKILCISGEDWHPGVIGIIASRVKDRTGKPTFIIGIDAQNIGKGSGRSIPGINIGGVVQKAKEEGILLNGGGHEMAAGLTVEKSKIDQLRQFMNEACKTEKVSMEKYFEVTLSVPGITLDLINMIEKLGPFGAENPRPFIMIPRVCAQNPRICGEKHYGLGLKGESGKSIDAMCFNAVGTPLDLLISDPHKVFHAIGTIELSEWRGKKRIKFYMKDAILAV